MIAVNSTHVTTGHEMWNGNTWILRTESFAVCSNGDLCADLSDRTVRTKLVVLLWPRSCMYAYGKETHNLVSSYVSEVFYC
jgi:hypothetical protein